MNARDRRLLALAGFTVEARGELFVDPDGSRTYVDPTWRLGTDQRLAERIADALIPQLAVKGTEKAGALRFYAFTERYNDTFDGYLIERSGYGRTRAEAMARVLYAWLDDQ